MVLRIVATVTYPEIMTSTDSKKSLLCLSKLIEIKKKRI
jgi:hypothetical protein